MYEGGSGEPGHERSILDRIPEPEAAPAERVVGPVRAHCNAEGQEAPGHEREGSDETRPGGVDPAFDQRRGGEGEDDREADIAEVQKRRMNGEARVLQDRIEIATLERRRIEPRKGVR